MYFTQALSELIHLCMSKYVSSTKVCALISSCVWSLIPFKFLLLVIFIRSISTAMMKIKGEIISPWGTPCSKTIFSVRCSHKRILAIISLRNNCNQLMMSSPELKFLKCHIFICDLWNRKLF